MKLRHLALPAALAAATALAACNRAPTPLPSPTATEPALAALPSPSPSPAPPTLPPATAVAFGQATVRFESPAAGARLRSPFEVCLAAEALEIRPPGPAEPGSGHFVVLVDPSQDLLLAIGAGSQGALPEDAGHVHLHGTSPCTSLDLAPGEYTLVAVVVGGDEAPLSPPVLDFTMVTVDGTQ